MRDRLGGKLSDKYGKFRHVENYDGRKIVVGLSYEYNQQNFSVVRVCCVTFASPCLLVVKYQSGHLGKRKGRKKIIEFLERLRPLSANSIENLVKGLSRKGGFLVSEINCPMGL